MDKTKVVIVEDEGIVALQIKTSLQQKGYDIAGIFASGEDLLQQIDSLDCELILMDIRIQGIFDGIETAEILKQKGLPIIYLTAHSDVETLERAGASLPYGYLMKPFDPQELHIAIQMAMLKHKSDKEKKELIEKLQEALNKVKILSGLLPICASCKKIRDDDGYWQQIETYIAEHSDLEFTHGLCPDCFKKLYPGYTMGQTIED
jgi:DNA-binding NarL/FixJ family response regulator